MTNSYARTAALAFQQSSAGYYGEARYARLANLPALADTLQRIAAAHAHSARYWLGLEANP